MIPAEPSGLLPSSVVVGVSKLEDSGLRPKLAADRSRVLNFYWMLVALVTGVYTFGLAGILIGPILIGMLKAIIDTVSAGTGWRVLDEGDADDTIGAGA